MKSLVAIALWSTVIFTHIGWALEEDRKHHGPLDGHAVKVYGILQEMDLPAPTLAECRGVAESSQAAWRNWFKINRAKVEQYQARIEELKAGDDRAELKKVLAEMKKLMHTAPSLLRGPEALKEVLSEDQYVAFLAELDELKKELHNPKQNQPGKSE